jgi:hypothetical protein
LIVFSTRHKNFHAQIKHRSLGINQGGKDAHPAI